MKRILLLIVAVTISLFSFAQRNSNVDLGSAHYQDILDFKRQIDIIKKKMSNNKYEDAVDRAKLLIMEKQFYKDGMPETYALLLESLCKLGDEAEIAKYSVKASSLGVNVDSLTTDCSANKSNPEIIRKRSVSFIEVGTGHRFGSDTISKLDLYSRNVYLSIRHHKPINLRSAITINILVDINDFGFPYLDNRKRPRYYGDSMIVNKYRMVSFQFGVGYEYLLSEKYNVRVTPNVNFFLPIRESIWVPNDKMYRSTMLNAVHPFHIGAGLDLEKRFTIKNTYLGIGANYRIYNYDHKPQQIGAFVRLSL